MKTVTFYRTDTGEITGSSTFHDDYLVTVSDGEACVQGEYDGERFYIQSGNPVEYPPKPHPMAKFNFAYGYWYDPRPLSMMKAEASRKLSQWVESQRRQYLTVLPGQEMIYLAKEAEALRYLNDPEPDLLNYPFISREIGITGDTGWQVAQVWAYMSNLWRETAAQLEQTRLGLGAQIDAAATVAELNAIILPSNEEPQYG